MKQLLGVLLLVGIILTYWKWIVVLLIIMMVIRLGPRVWGAYQQGQQVRRAELEALAARAVQQHAWTGAGDPRGTFGDYTPVELTQ